MAGREPYVRRTMSGSGVNSVAVAKSYFAAVNETRLDDLAAVFVEDGVLSFPMLSPIEGRKAIRDFYAGVLQFYPERYDHVTRWFVSEAGDVAAEIHFEGRTSTGRDVIFDAVDVFTIKNDLIQKLSIFYDSARVLEMVGELPK
jgi:ketosteroid isomerase-like protein